MSEKISFELFIDSDAIMERRAYSEMSDKFGVVPSLMFDELTDRLFTTGRFHTIEIEGSWADAWTVAQNLVSIDGVMDVDSIFPTDIVFEIDAMIEDLVARMMRPAWRYYLLISEPGFFAVFLRPLDGQSKNATRERGISAVSRPSSTLRYLTPVIRSIRRSRQ